MGKKGGQRNKKQQIVGAGDLQNFTTSDNFHKQMESDFQASYGLIQGQISNFKT